MKQLSFVALFFIGVVLGNLAVKFVESDPPKVVETTATLTPADIADNILKEVWQIVSTNEGDFVLTCFVGSNIEIIGKIKSKADWNDEYREELKDTIIKTVLRGGNLFQLIQLEKRLPKGLI